MDPPTIMDLHERGRISMCYFSARIYEEWRPEALKFPGIILGNDPEGWPGEKWLDIRLIDLLGPIMESGMDLPVQTGCHGVDPDNHYGYENYTGFNLSGADQMAHNPFLAQAAHARGLSTGLKNDPGQIPDLAPYFDRVLNEECFFLNKCDMLPPFVEAGKPVFVFEHDQEPQDFRPQANSRDLMPSRRTGGWMNPQSTAGDE